MNTSYRTLGIVLTIIFLVGVGVFLVGDADSGSGTTIRNKDPIIAATGSAVIEQGIQYVDITARAGYSPRSTQATAGMPTVIRMRTQDTYDCSSTVVIPTINYQGTLLASGVTDIPIPADKAYGTLEGMCGMNMYQFSIVFG